MPLNRTWCKFPRAIILAVLLAPLAFPQSDAPLDGTVISPDSQPIAGVSVSGSESKICCPFKREHAKTDERGAFHLEHPGAVLHFFHKDYEPQSVMVQPGAANLKIRLAPLGNELVAADCSKQTRAQREIGWGKYGMRFSVARRGVQISGGKPDADYVLYLIRPDNSQAELELWFGANAMGLDPADQQFLNSTSFFQRNIRTAKGELLGVDTRGELKDGEIWRHAAVVTQGGAKYQTSRKDEAETFDTIINSMCWIPWRE
jgi:hypothetical protein